MKILIKNATLITMDSNSDEIQENKDILIEEDTIKQIAQNIQDKDAMLIDATNKIVMPGLINTHAHIAMSVFRETLDGYSLQDWLQEKIWPMEDKLTNEDVYDASMLSCIEMIKTGTTTINDMYFMPESTIQAALKTGVRIQLTRTLIDLNGEGQMKIEELENLLEQYTNKYSNVSFNIGIHGFYTTNEPYIERCVALAKKYSLPIHIHFCENQKEVQDIQKQYQIQSPVMLLKKYFKGIHVILAHAVKLTKEEIEELVEQDIYISHCPVSNLKLGCGIANITQMLEQGICVCLGTDGQGSGSNLDLFETMKYTALLQKGVQENPKVLPAYELLKLATINGAKALKMENTIGSLEEGKLADIIILNQEEVTTQPVNNLISEMVYNMKGTNVETVIINGKIVMQDRKLVGIDEQEVYQRCRAIINRIKIDN